jgi:hypothetical protein
MADEKKPAAPATPAAAAAAPTTGKVTAESEAKERVEALTQKVAQLESEVRTLEGRAANRDPRVVAAVKRENETLKKRIEALEQALYGLLAERASPHSPEELKQKTEILQQTAAEYCKKNSIDQSLWKNLVS